MPRPRVTLAAVLVATLLLTAGGVVVLAAAEVWRAGTFVLSVRDEGPNGARVAVVVPGIVATLAAVAIPFMLPDEAAARIRPAAPAMRALASELAGLPDAVYVAVEAPGERVLIASRGGVLVIEVDDGPDHVRLAIPLHAARRVLRSVAFAAQRTR